MNDRENQLLAALHVARRHAKAGMRSLTIEDKQTELRWVVITIDRVIGQESDGDTKRFYSDKANRGYGPHSDQD